MSTLTKVFVILLVVFSIAFTSMTVSIAARTTNWREVAQRYEEHARVADTNLRHLIAANAAELASATDAVNRHQRTIAELETRLKEAETEAAQLQGELARARSDRSNLEAMQRTTLALLQNAQSESEAYRGQRGDLETQSIDLRQRNIDLNDRVNELTASVDVLIEQKRQAEQQINMLSSENKRMSRRLEAPSAALAMEDPDSAAMRRVAPRTPISATAIRGRITKIEGDIVTMSVGASDGVERDMVFVVYRGEEYIGDVEVVGLTPDECAGRLTSSTIMPTPGDFVADLQSFQASRR
ncbi:MAG: hypothetical protein ACPGXK_04405 [Phycisphaerae bacterium]